MVATDLRERLLRERLLRAQQDIQEALDFLETKGRAAGDRDMSDLNPLDAIIMRTLRDFARDWPNRTARVSDVIAWTRKQPHGDHRKIGVFHSSHTLGRYMRAHVAAIEEYTGIHFWQPDPSHAWLMTLPEIRR